MTDQEFIKELNKIKLKELSDEQLIKMGLNPYQVRSYEPGQKDSSKSVAILLIGVVVVGCIGKWVLEGDPSFILDFVNIFKDFLSNL